MELSFVVLLLITVDSLMRIWSFEKKQTGASRFVK